MPRVAVAFGSNLGDRHSTIAKSLGRVGAVVSGMAVSSLYETDAMYKLDQPAFLNGVLVGETKLEPAGLLTALKTIERDLGRQGDARNGPREIDLDIVWYEGYASPPGQTPDIPHPRAHERRFVLEPLNEIAPDLLLPGYGVVRDLLSAPGVQSQQVRRVADAPILL